MAGLFLLGRLLFGGYFVYSGFNHFVSTAMMAQYAGAKGVPSPEIAVLATGVLMLAGGTMILLGLWPHVGALCIVVFLAGVTPIMHNFWTASDAGARTADMMQFTKNLALLGGALGLLGVPRPWPFSVEERRHVTV
jgi:uncharacterized membrane protein YphA (DoxX/SURF4 family)